MIGINEGVLDRIINTNDVYLDSIREYRNNIIDSINELENCYSGKELEKVLGEPYKQIKNLKNIVKVIDSYSDVLTDVIKAYQKQNSNIKTFMKHANSKNN